MKTSFAAISLWLAVVNFAVADEVTLAIDKMFCERCGYTVKKSLSKVPGVQDVRVDIDRKVVSVRFDESKATVDDLSRATAKAGFPAVAAKRSPQ